MASSLPSDSSKPWDPQKYGMDLLGQLGQLASQTEANLWTAAALFGAAQGVLLLAFFNVVAIGAPLPYAAGFVQYWAHLIGLAGAVLSLASIFMSLLLDKRRAAWISKASQLQSKLKIPEEVAPWTFPEVAPWTGRFSLRSSGVVFLIVIWGIFLLTWFIVLGSA